jgi:hypothetical protein
MVLEEYARARVVLWTSLAPDECEALLRTLVQPLPRWAWTPLDRQTLYGEVSPGRFRLKRGGQRGISDVLGRFQSDRDGTRIEVELDTPLDFVGCIAAFIAFIWLLVLSGLAFGFGSTNVSALPMFVVITGIFAVFLSYFLGAGRRDKDFYLSRLKERLEATVVQDSRSF